MLEHVDSVWHYVIRHGLKFPKRDPDGSATVPPVVPTFLGSRSTDTVAKISLCIPLIYSLLLCDTVQYDTQWPKIPEPRARPVGRSSTQSPTCPSGRSAETLVWRGGGGRPSAGGNVTHSPRVHRGVCRQHEPPRTRHWTHRPLPRTETPRQDRRWYSAATRRHRRKDISASFTVHFCLFIALWRLYIFFINRENDNDSTK